jgi:pilin isopeptide linkage protein
MITMKRALLGLALVIMMAAAGIVPAYAASSYSDPVTVSIKYIQNYEADSNHSDQTFRYSVTPVSGAPAPKGSTDGVYYFTVQSNPKKVRTTGKLDLNMTFSAPGEYKYTIKSDEKKPVKNVLYDKTVYTAHVYVKNAASGGLTAQVVMTAKDSKKKYSAVEFSHSYRKGNDDDERPITTPDDDDHHVDDTPDDDPQPTPTNPTVTPTNDPTDDDDDPDDIEERDDDDDEDEDDGGAGTTDDGTPGQGGPDNGGTTPQDGKKDDGDKTIIERIGDLIPKADPNREYWSLLNLLAAVASVILALIMAFRFFQRIDTDEDEYVIRRGGKLRLLSIPPAVISAIVFFLTEDLSKPEMRLTDEWTPFMMIMLLLSMFVAALVYKAYDTGDNDEQKPA